MPGLSGHDKVVRGMAHFLPSLPSEALAKEGMVQILLSITLVAVHVISEPKNYHGAGFIKPTGERVRV